MTQPAAARQIEMTGFGAVTPEGSAPTVNPAPAANGAAPAATQANAPGVVSAFEGSIDDRLNALLQG